MSIYDKSSLVLIPSGTKAGKVYSQKPVSGDGDFTFTRSSAATRINADGNIEKETSNLLLQSNSFDTTWVSSNTTETGGQSGYDGTNDAWLITKSSAFANVAQSVSASGVNTYSVYAKTNTLNWLRIVGGSTSAFFDLNNGVVGSTDAGNIAKMTSIGSGWYRCEVAMNASTTIMRIYPADGDNDVSGSSGSIYIQDAQLNQGLIAQEVITTTTSAVEGGITDNVPRLDYTDSSCPALLLEPQRTNVTENSEYFNGTDWSKANTTIESNSIISPDGLLNASKLIENTANDRHSITKSFSTSATYNTISAFFKKGTRRYASIVTSDTTYWNTMVVIDLEDGSITKEYNRSGITSTNSVEDYGNGWYRLIASINGAPTGSTLYTRFTIQDSATPSNPPNNSYQGDGVSGIYIWGTQVELGATYATSYIPTFGSAVTRNGDICDSAGTSATFNDSEGVLYAEISALYDDQTSRRITISDGTNTNRIVTGYNASSNQIFYFIIVAGSTIASGSYTTTDITAFHKVAIKYKVNDFALWVDGVERHTDSSGAIFAADTLSEMQFTQGSGSGLNFYGNTKQVIYISTALTDAELQDLTTL